MVDIRYTGHQLSATVNSKRRFPASKSVFFLQNKRFCIKFWPRTFYCLDLMNHAAAKYQEGTVLEQNNDQELYSAGQNLALIVCIKLYEK